MLVQQSLTPQTIAITDGAENVSTVIGEMAESLLALLKVNRATIERAMLERERVRSTAFANGAAIPHCRLPGLDRFGLAVRILRQPVRWDHEGRAVDCVMMIAGPSDQVSEHLRILANCSQLLDSEALRAKLKRSPDAQSAYELIAAAEEAVETRRSREGMLRELRRDQENGARPDPLAEVAGRFDW